MMEVLPRLTAICRDSHGPWHVLQQHTTAMNQAQIRMTVWHSWHNLRLNTCVLQSFRQTQSLALTRSGETCVTYFAGDQGQERSREEEAGEKGSPGTPYQGQLLPKHEPWSQTADRVADTWSNPHNSSSSCNSSKCDSPSSTCCGPVTACNITPRSSSNSGAA